MHEASFVVGAVREVGLEAEEVGGGGGLAFHFLFFLVGSTKFLV